jgi:uncharacterized protein (TIRG00374 family)
LLVKPRTVIGWHRTGFRFYWKWKSRRGRGGRPGAPQEIRTLIRDMSSTNVLWGAPRLQGELLKLGIEVSQATVAKYIVRHRKPPSQTWRTFLANHVKQLVSVDFFVVPTVSFRILYVFICCVREPGIAQHSRCEDRNSLYTAFVLGDSGYAAGPAFMKRTVQIGISLALTAAIGYLVYRGVPDWGQALRVMLRGRPLMLLAGILLVLVHMLLRALRWGVLLSPVKKGVSFRNLFSLTVVKYVVNIIPPRTGEVAASVVLARKEAVPVASVIAASLLERILDMMAVLFLFGVYVVAFARLYTPASQRGRDILLSAQGYSLKSLIVLAIGFVMLAVLLRNPRTTAWIPSKLRSHFLPFLEGFRALESRGGIFKAALLSAAIWLCITTQLWCFTRAYLDSFPFSGSLLLMVLTVVGVAIPTPAGVGGFQFFMSIALVHLFSQYLSPNDPHSQAAGISNGTYLASMGPVLILGLVLLNYEGLSLGWMTRIAPPNARGGENT